MTERPILFSGPMVRAILAGRKTQTRRAVRWPEWVSDQDRVKLMRTPGLALYVDGNPLRRMTCPYGSVGDHLWVRETWAQVLKGEDCRQPEGEPQRCPCGGCRAEYRADLPDGCTDQPGGWDADSARGDDEAPHWRPSIFMPRWACRVELEVTGVRAEQVHDLSEANARAEGVADRGAYRALWDRLNAKRGFAWDLNPWVWVVEFKRR